MLIWFGLKCGQRLAICCGNGGIRGCIYDEDFIRPWRQWTHVIEEVRIYEDNIAKHLAVSIK